jgi:hypothetical protein
METRNFSERISHKFDSICGMCSVIWTVVLWALWMERNDAIFNNEFWSPNKMLLKISIGIIDSERMDWTKTQAQVKKRPRSRRILVKRFVRRWSRNGVFAHSVDL